MTTCPLIFKGIEISNQNEEATLKLVSVILKYYF